MPPKASAKGNTPTPGRPQKAQSQHKHVAKSKKPVSDEEKVKRLFRSLCAQIDGGHFANALKTCEKILRIDHKDVDALQAKLFLLLQTEQYEAALALLPTLSSSSLQGQPQQHEYEKAYALYRLHRESEAEDLLSKLKEERGQGSGAGSVHARGITHLEAQLAYRQCAYQSAFDLYSQLLDTSSAQSEEHEDLLTNLTAAQTHLDFLTTGYLRSLNTILPASTINTLETTPPPAPPGSSGLAIPGINTASLDKTTPAPVDDKQKKTRLRRVPKGVILGVTPPPDPERWLKKSERTTFNQGAAGRRRKAAGGATQGSAVETTSGQHSGGKGQGSSGTKQKKKK